MPALALMRFGLALVLVGAAVTGSRAQDATAGHPLDAAARTLGIKADVGKMPDFVEQSRTPDDDQFMSVGISHPTRPIKARNPAEVKSLEAELDAARMRNERIAGRPITPMPGAPGSAKPSKGFKAKPVSPTKN